MPADQDARHRHTNHGHPCCNQTPDGPAPALVAKCGGPGLCPRCFVDAGQIHAPIATEETTDA